MKRSSFWRRLQAAMAAIAAFSVIALPFGRASAADDEVSPFGDAVKIADAALDTMRGGMATNDGNLMRFAVNVVPTINGTPIASVSIDNLKGGFELSSANLGHTVTVPVQGGIQAQGANTPQTPSGTVSFSFGGPNGSAQTNAVPVTFTTSLVPASPAASPSPAAVASALDTIHATTHPGTVLATTTLLPDGHGLMTLVQNVNSNVAIHLMQTINIQLSGVGTTLLRNGNGSRAFANSMSLSLHH